MHLSLQWKSYKYYVICVLVAFRYPACNAHVSYFDVICDLPGCTVFSTLSHKQHDFWRKKLMSINWVVDIVYISFWNISHSKKKWARYDKKMYIGLHVKYPLFLSDFNGTWTFSTDFRKILKYHVSKKIRRVRADLFHAARRTDRRTDVTKLIIAFRNFANESKQGTPWHQGQHERTTS